MMLHGEMSLTLRPECTGLPFDVWISESIYAQHHRPRLKVSRREKLASVSVDEPVQVLVGSAITEKDWKKLVTYIEQNRQLLLDLWASRIDQVDYLERHPRLP